MRISMVQPQAIPPVVSSTPNDSAGVIHPDSVYSLDAFLGHACVSKSKYQQVQKDGLELKKFNTGKRCYVKGSDGIAWLEAQHKRRDQG